MEVDAGALESQAKSPKRPKASQAPRRGSTVLVQPRLRDLELGLRVLLTVFVCVCVGGDF